MERATTLQDILKVTLPQPLKGEDFDNFWWDCDNGRGDKPAEKLCNLLKVRKDMPSKILFTGLGGTGKSTELYRLSRDIKDDFLTVIFSISDKLDPNDIDYTDILMIIAEQVYLQAEKEGIKINKKALESINNWFSEVYTEYQEKEGASIEVEGGLSAVLAKFTGKLKSARESRQVIRQTVEKRADQLIEFCNILIREVEDKLLKKSGRRILIIVDDIERAKVGEQKTLFIDNASTLISLNCHVIYTANIFLCYSTHHTFLADNFKIEKLPVIKTHDKDWNPDKDGIDTIKEMVNKRMDINLFEEGVLDKAVFTSGGSFRDLLKFIEGAVLQQQSIDKSKEKVSMESMEFAINVQKNAMKSSLAEFSEPEDERIVKVSEYYTTLLKVYKTKNTESDPVTRRLFYLRAILEYNGAHQWADVHPLIKMVIEDMGLI